MSKAVLVINMPEKCSECPMLNSNDECILQDEDTNAFYVDDYDGLRKGCPLGYLPETKVYPNLDSDYKCGFVDGWNACIQEVRDDYR